VKIATRLNLLSLAVILVMTAAVLAATLFFIEASERQSYERVMQLELQTATQAIRQQLNRSGVVAASKEAAAQLERLRSSWASAKASPRPACSSSRRTTTASSTTRAMRWATVRGTTSSTR
jgi:GTP1/Obg family GTP-binding protein